MLHRIKTKIYGCYRKQILARFYPEKIIDGIYHRLYGSHPDLKNPANLSEKINWLKLHSDLRKWARLSDKYAVREYVESKGHGDTLTDLYGVYSKAGDIDFNALPQSFVIRTNNRSGDTLLVPDKSKVDTEKVRADYQRLLETPFGDQLYEPHYHLIKPKIIIGQYLENKGQPVESTSLVDFKVWCFNGAPKYVEVYMNRTKDNVEIQFYTPDWELIRGAIKDGLHYSSPEVDIKRPDNLEQMLKIASDLAGPDEPCVRVDMYSANGKIYFGELTFTNAGGFPMAVSREFMREMGEQVNIRR